MGNRLIVQGAGKFATFSTIVDNITFYDETIEEMVARRRQEAADEAERRVREWCSGPTPGRTHYTVDEAVEWVCFQHGDEEAETVRRLLSGETGDPDELTD